MARGAPDDSNIKVEGILHGVHELGELAVRLGSPAGWGRSGNLLYADTFKDGLGKGVVSGTGSGDYGVLENGSWAVDGVALKITGDGNPEAFYWLVYSLPWYGSERLGGEVSFSIDNEVKALGVSMYAYTEDTMLRGTFYYNAVDQYLYSLAADDSEIVIASSVRAAYASSPTNVIKLVIDPVAGKHSWGQFNGHVYDLRNIELVEQAAAFPDTLDVYFVMYEQGSTPASVVLDRVLITTNEGERLDN